MSYALSEARTFRKNRKKTIPILKNIGMRSMQDLFFLAGWVEMGQFVVLHVFVFVTEKSITFKKRKYRRDRKKPNLSSLTQILCDLLSLLSK